MLYEDEPDDNHRGDNDYWRDLILWRPLMENLTTIASKVFVPETSPILLYSRGLVVSYSTRGELDPFEILDLDQLSLNCTIILWSSTLVTTLPYNTQRGVSSQFFKIFDPITHEFKVYTSTSEYPRFLFVVTSQTGSIQRDQLQFLKGEFKKRKISFFLPDVIVQVHKEFNENTSLTEDFNLESQFDAIMTGDMDIKVPLKMYDTTFRANAFVQIYEKVKWFFLATKMYEPDVILKGMNDPLHKDLSLYRISPPSMWAYGVDGKSIGFDQGEYQNFMDNEPNDLTHAQDGLRYVSKLNLDVINFNNKLEFLSGAVGYGLPTIRQTTNGVIRSELYVER